MWGEFILTCPIVPGRISDSQLAIGQMEAGHINQLWDTRKKKKKNHKVFKNRKHMPNGKGILQERQAAPTNDSNQPFMIRQSLTQLRTVVKSIWADAKRPRLVLKVVSPLIKKTVLLQISAFGRLFRCRNCLPVACCGHLGGGGEGGKWSECGAEVGVRYKAKKKQLQIVNESSS